MAGLRLAGSPVFRPVFALFDRDYMEKRQVFLRSYQFSRKQTAADRIRGSLVRVRRLISVKLRAARRLRRLVWLRLRHAACVGARRRRFHPLHVPARTSRAAAPSRCGLF
uniref:Uncharacterized protein n=1 Tax=Anthurium amnicola TaxID=1678845 RepID=A0A1D1XKT4_9ARAE